ncbi:hypothetical protein MCNS_08420 [Mycobacterium conspicuum]|jgi:hypothetical protein|uniref:Uncharacterized protein n=1 Tax=Mycobacterium conspicuum TaxID=44010 RepID=A0A7I7Y7W4_9MYCO|nr:hypothetical protein MCNS_08420 [Mycobacterium conspicuum]
MPGNPARLTSDSKNRLPRVVGQTERGYCSKEVEFTAARKPSAARRGGEFPTPPNFSQLTDAIHRTNRNLTEGSQQ